MNPLFHKICLCTAHRYLFIDLKTLTKRRNCDAVKLIFNVFFYFLCICVRLFLFVLIDLLEKSLFVTDKKIEEEEINIFVFIKTDKQSKCKH